MKAFFLTVLILLILAPLAALGDEGLLWCALNVNAGGVQGDAHLLKFPSGRTILIDAGDNGLLVSLLAKYRIRKIDSILITHAHKDHYSGIRSILANGITVGEVFANPVDRSTCDAEIPWGCDYQDYNGLLEELRQSRIEVRSVKMGDVLWKEADSSLQALYAFDGVSDPFGKSDVNDSTVIARLEYGRSSVLFAADLNLVAGEWLARHGKNLKATLLKAPHHAAESFAPDSFLDSVGFQAAVVTAPKSLWESERTSRFRSYIERNRKIVFVNGLQGTVSLKLLRTGSYEVVPEQ